MSKFKGAKNYIFKSNPLKLDMKNYTKEEMDELQLQKLKVNIVRIQVISVLILVSQIMRFIINILAEHKFVCGKWYIKFDIVVLIGIALHECIYFLWIKKRKRNRVKEISYVVSWYLCFAAASILFLFVEVSAPCFIYNFFAFAIIILIVPLISTKLELIYLFALFLLQFFFLLIRNANLMEYQVSFFVVFLSFFLGRMLYANFVRITILNFRLNVSTKELELQNKRFSILQNLTKETVFEYNFKEDKMLIMNSKDNDKKVIYNYIEKLKHQYHSVENIDVRESINAYRELIYGKKRDKIEFQYKDKEGNTKYSKAIFTTIYDGKNPIKLIGKVYDIEK